MKLGLEMIHEMSASEKIRPFTEMPSIIRNLNKAGVTVILAQGVFDIIHLGHVGYLRASRNAVSTKSLLVVGVENDASVSRNKGSGRPINNLTERLDILAEFMSTGLVFAYEDEPDYTKPTEYIARYKALGPALISVPSWDPHKDLKTYQARKANSHLALVDYKHTNSTTQMLRKVGYER